MAQTIRKAEIAKEVGGPSPCEIRILCTSRVILLSLKCVLAFHKLVCVTRPKCQPLNWWLIEAKRALLHCRAMFRVPGSKRESQGSSFTESGRTLQKL